jgi:hypothetical protein
VSGWGETYWHPLRLVTGLLVRAPYETVGRPRSRKFSEDHGARQPVLSDMQDLRNHRRFKGSSSPNLAMCRFGQELQIGTSV